MNIQPIPHVLDVARDTAIECGRVCEHKRDQDGKTIAVLATRSIGKAVVSQVTIATDRTSANLIVGHGEGRVSTFRTPSDPEIRAVVQLHCRLDDEQEQPSPE